VQVYKRSDRNGQWTVEISIPNTAIVTLHVRTEQSADTICRMLAEHVVEAHALTLSKTQTATGPRGRAK
jgi:hypothetical protein